MDDERMTKQRAPEPREREPAERQAASAPPRDERDRKPTPIERRDWRGSGVCGDSHTD